MEFDFSDIYFLVSQGFFIGFAVGTIASIANVAITGAMRLFKA